MRLATILILGFLFALHGVVYTQAVPSEIKGYLSKSYRGWKLSPSEYGCGSETNSGVVSGYFDGDRQKDYAVKFVRRNKGFFVAFLKRGATYKPFVLESTTAEEMKASAVSVWKKGERYEVDDTKVYLRYDAPADFRCESDVGGIHLYRKGRFIGY